VRGCIHALNLVLVILLCLQGLIVALTMMRLEIPVPARLMRSAVERLGKEGLDLRWDSIKFDLTGGVRAQNLHLNDLEGQHLLSASQVYFRVRLSSLLSGRIDPNLVQMDDASAILPASMSPDGTERKLVEHASISASARERIIQIYQAQLLFAGRMPVHATGSFRLPAPGLPGQEVCAAASEPVFLRALSGYLRQADQAARKLQDTDTPDLYITGGEDGTISTVMTALTARYGDWTATEIAANLRMDSGLRVESVQAQAQRIEGPELNIGRTQILALMTEPLPLSATALKQARLELRAYVAQASVRNEVLKGVALDAVRTHGHISAAAALQLDGLPASLEADIPDGGSPTLRYDLYTRIGPWLRLAGISEQEVGKRLSVEQPILLTGQARRDANGEVETDFDLLGWGLDAHGTPIDFAHASGHADRHAIVCDEVLLQGGQSSQRGSFSQNFDTMDWRLRLKGDVMPPALGPMLGLWWNDIWTDFVFDGPPVSADLDLNGNWHERHYANILGTVRLDHILYHGVRLEKGTLTLYVGKGFVELYDIDASSDKGNISGNLAWLLEPGRPMVITFSMLSSLPLEQLDKAFGSALKDQIPDWEMPESPNVSVRGNVLHMIDGSWRSEIEAGALVSDGVWRGIPFRLLSVKILHRNERTDVGIPFARLMNGQLRGSVSILHAGGPSSIRLDLHLEKADMGAALDAILKLGGKGKDKKDNKDKKDEQPRHGKVRLDFKGDAFLNDVPGTMTGSGSFALSDADLGKIKIFGALTSLLDSVGLGFSSFNLDTMKSDFSMDYGYARMRNAELNGPAARIEAKGILGLIDNSLDFDAKVFLLQSPEPSLMNVLGTILSPVGHILELRLKGSVDEPAWRFRIDPRNLFDTSQSAGEAALKGRR
jgi:hypothetical protein